MASPWFKHYPVDEMSDAGLRMSSLAARGLWREIVNLAHAAEPRGHLLVNGKPPTIKALANLCAATVAEVEACLAELKENGVYSEIDGVIVSRRMVRDTAKAKRDAENGGLGGNPNLAPKPTTGVNPPVNPSVNGVPNPKVDRQDKAQKPEARDQNPDHLEPEQEEEREPGPREDRAGLSLACYTAFEEAHIEIAECPWGGRKSVSRQTRQQFAEIVNSRKDVATFAHRFKIVAAHFLSRAGAGAKFPYDTLTFANFIRHFATFEIDAIAAGRIDSLDSDGRAVVYQLPETWRQKCERLGHAPKCSTLAECMCVQETGARPPRSADVWDAQRRVSA